MDRTINGSATPSNSASYGFAGRSAFSPLQPNYSSQAVQEALERLASIDLIELCNEAKVEHCRATRDLRSCGRYVHHVLNSCGHASLCAECSQRYDLCPICRTPITKNGPKIRLRIYYECIEVGLISKRCDERFQEKEAGEKELTADVQHLYNLFDVALENNLVSLVCHYVTDVCMDESAVSSDPVIAFLLDEVVVKDWCKQTFKNIIRELKVIYNFGIEEMKSRLSLLLKFSVQLAGISNVLETLELSFKGSVSAQLEDLHHLQESILKTKQHMEIMIWCIRHQFLKNVSCRHTSLTSWRSVVGKRKVAAIELSWPNALDDSLEASGPAGSLFIEDALRNLEIEQSTLLEMEEELEMRSLQEDGTSLNFRSDIEEGVATCYPFGSLRAAVDVLFLYGSSDLVVSKQAIFLYYLFDWHWTLPDEEWRSIIEDFAATFNIKRHSMLESLVFYLLDDHTEEALQEAGHLLVEISSPEIHPKITQVLLERKMPDQALMLLRWSGRDMPESLGEAVTAVRVRVECGLLIEAFTYQRMICKKVRETKKYGLSRDVSGCLKGECRNWEEWVKVLVTEICALCIRRNLVDRIIELPWNSDEEKHLHKFLLEWSMFNPSTTVGSLLFLYYLQRYRYSEAYHVNLMLRSVEHDFISENIVDEDGSSRMGSISHWREGFVDKFMKLLPDVQQNQVKAGKLAEIGVTSGGEVAMPVKHDPPISQEESSFSLLIPSSIDASFTPNTKDPRALLLKPLASETPGKLGGALENQPSKFGNGTPSILQKRLFTNMEREQKSQDSLFSRSFKFENTSRSASHWANPMNVSPLQKNRNQPRTLPNTDLPYNHLDKISPYLQRVTTNPLTTPNRNNGLFKMTSNDTPRNASNKRAQSDREVAPLKMVNSNDPAEISWGQREETLSAKGGNVNGELRWRSDETSDEEERGMEHLGTVYNTTPSSGIRRPRLVKR